MRVRTRQVALLVAVVALVAAGLVTGWRLAATTPAQLRSPDPVVSAPLSAQSFDDERQVDVTPLFGTAQVLSAPLAGLVTAVDCQPGTAWTSGATPIAIDGQPVVALATRVPLWRDIPTGTKGDDVLALQQELVRLGVGLSPTGTLGPVWLTAVQNFLKNRGVSLSGSVVPRADFIWLPQSSVTISSCAASVGSQVDAAAALATGTAPLVGLQIDPLPTGPVAGDRTLSVNGATGPVNAAGLVTDSAMLVKVAPSIPAAQSTETSAGSSGTSSSTDSGQSAALNGVYALSKPINAFVVPPAAIIGAGTTQTCVDTDSGRRDVTILSSNLGRTMISFTTSAAAPKQVRILADSPESCA